MRKKKKTITIPIMESVKEAQDALLTKIIEKIDDNSLKMTSCEIRMYILDAINVH